MKRFKNKLIYILILLFLALTAVVVKMAMEYQRETEYRRENIKTTVVDDKYDEILYVETGAINPIDTVIVTKQNTRYAYTKLVFPGEYIYLADCEYTYDFKEGDILKIDKAQYEICDLTASKNSPISISSNQAFYLELLRLERHTYLTIFTPLFVFFKAVYFMLLSVF